MSTDDEREAAKKAQEILSSLTPSTPRTDKIMFALGRAAGIATDGSMKDLSSEAVLHYVRAATALRAVCGQLDRQSLTQKMVDRAKQAVEAWANELNESCQ
jgi:hypothetical protein